MPVASDMSADSFVLFYQRVESNFLKRIALNDSFPSNRMWQKRD